MPHFLGLMIGETAGIDLQHVPFQGGAPAMTALMGGHIGYTVDVVVESLEQHRAGKVRMIAVAGAQRAPQAPEVPTLREQGVPMDASAWFAMYGPGSLPAATTHRTHHGPAARRGLFHGPAGARAVCRQRLSASPVGLTRVSPQPARAFRRSTSIFC